MKEENTVIDMKFWRQFGREITSGAACRELLIKAKVFMDTMFEEVQKNPLNSNKTSSVFI